MSDWTTEEHKDIHEAFEDYVFSIELPFDNIEVNGKVWKLMYEAFQAGYKFGVYN